ncbi:hypothetical protein F5Y14DRAFT_407368 [Nemania sp. NC0429]|nr:hypothetical protein F5Y14DRAFT_407368 [Nemania sp. NC0429]
MSQPDLSAILNGPALEPPEGKIPQLGNPPNDNVLAFVIVSIAFSLSTIAILCRIYVRFFILRHFTFAGDWLLIFAYAFLIVDFYISYQILRVPGAFVHQWDVSLGHFIEFLKNVFISSQLYIGVILPIKLAILLEWIRIFVPSGSRNLVFWASHIMIFVVIGFYIALIVAFNVACTPIEANWNVLINGDCTRVDTKYTNISASAFNLISDVLILLIPQRVIWKLNMSTQKKIGVSLVFAVGLFACAASLIRLVETVRHAESPDFTYTFSGIMLVSASEIALGFLVISLPYIPTLFGSIDISTLRSKLSFSNGSRLISSRKQVSESAWSGSRYSKMDQKRKSDPEMDSIQLRMLPPAYVQTSIAEATAGDAGDLVDRAEQGGIMRTTRFHAVESYETDSPLK